jgi:hypothetical protein
MGPLIDLTGQRFGRWTVLALSEGGHNARWLCTCDCGTTRPVTGKSLRGGVSTSCGCRTREVSSARLTKHGHTRGYTETRAYRAWRAMINRCTNPNDESWEYYGGRGIKICRRWRRSFKAFYADMGDPPPGMTLDRWPNNDGNYEPGNCRWATPKQQRANQRPKSRHRRPFSAEVIARRVATWHRNRRIKRLVVRGVGCGRTKAEGALP